MEKCYVYDIFQKRKYDSPSALPIRKLVHQKYGFEYTVAVRGYNYFKTMWQPKENEVLVCQS